MNKLFTKIAALVLGMTMAVGVGVAVGSGVKASEVGASSDPDYTAATMTPGTNGSACTVNGNDGIKVGTSKKGGDMSITVPLGATDLRIYSAAWNGVTGLSLNITKVSGASSATISQSSISLTADSGISNNSPFTLAGTESNFRFDFTLTNITENTTFKFTGSTTSRFVVWSAQTKEAATTVEATGMDITPTTSTTIYAGESVSFTTALTGGSGDYEKTISWETSDASIIAKPENSEDGESVTVTSLAAGVVTLTGTVVSPGSASNSITITVNAARTITGVSLSGDMTEKTYADGDEWDVDGLYLSITWSIGDSTTIPLTELTKDVDYFMNPDSASAGDTSINITGEYEGFKFSKTITGITVSSVPGRINFGTTSGYWNPTENGATTKDNKGNSVKITSNSGAAYSQQGTDYKQIGTNNNAATEVLITIDLADKSGIDALSIKYAGAASRSNHTVLVYGDSENDVILNGAISGSTSYEQSTGQEYTKINANSIHVKFTGNVANCGGIKIFYIQYTLGSQAQEFGTLASIEVSSSSLHNTVFEVNQTFSTEGLVITATDTVGFTKDFVSGFTTDYDGVTFVETAENLKVTVSLTLDEVTATTFYYINVIEIPSYSLASSQDALYEGMRVIIAYIDGDNVFTAGALSGSYLEKVNGSKDGSDILAGEGTYEFVVEYYGSNILLRHGANYLKHTGDKSVTMTSTIDAACAWSYDGECLQNVSKDSYYLQYNKTSPRFTDYSGTQQDVGLYISSATPKTDVMGAETFAQKYLHMRDYDPELHVGEEGSNYCSDSTHHYYLTAKAAYNDLSAEEKTEFASLASAKARYEAWALANRDGAPYDGNDDIQTPLSGRIVFFGSNENSNMIAIVVIVSVVSLTAVGGYFFLRKKREQN